jgi:hypothetical protein
LNYRSSAAVDRLLLFPCGHCGPYVQGRVRLGIIEPNGRREGQMNVATMFRKVTQAVILVTENGKSRKDPKMEAI